MNIYEPAVFSGDEKELKRLASFLAEHLLPGAVPLSPPIGSDPIQFHLRQKEMLIGFFLYAHELNEGGFEALLEHAARLETRRSEQHDPTLQEIGICLIACGFSQNFLSRVPFELVRIGLTEWSVIRSGNEESLLVRNIRKGLSFDHYSPRLQKTQAGESAAAHTPQFSPQELSTPELVSLSRFGMELRSRREQV